MIILLGASASGKTEVAKELVKNYNFKKVVTYTTRDLRVGEVDGRDYHFISAESFKNKIDEVFFFEYVNYNGNFYGTAKSDLTIDSVVILEPNGFKAYRESTLPNIVSFYLESDEEHRINWMRKRGDSEEKISSRIINDRISFNESNIKGINYVLNSNDLSIEELTKEVNDIYKKRIEMK